MWTPQIPLEVTCTSPSLPDSLPTRGGMVGAKRQRATHALREPLSLFDVGLTSLSLVSASFSPASSALGPGEPNARGGDLVIENGLWGLRPPRNHSLPPREPSSILDDHTTHIAPLLVLYEAETLVAFALMLAESMTNAASLPRGSLA